MSYNTFDIGKVCISSSFRLSKNIFRVENIEAFIFHGAHIEITYRHNHEALEIQL